MGFSYQGDSHTFKGDTASFGAGALFNFPIHTCLTARIDAMFSMALSFMLACRGTWCACCIGLWPALTA
jgi:hypothetical protein